MNTRALWDGKYAIDGFDRDHIPTVGQVITVPPDATDLEAFRYYICTFDAGTQRTVRGEVYAWNGTQATGGPLWEGSAQQVTGKRHCANRTLTFHVGGLALTAGSQYIIFMTLSKDDGQPSDGVWAYGALTGDGSYPGGTNYVLNDHGDETQWTTRSWQAVPVDMAMKAWLRPHSG